MSQFALAKFLTLKAGAAVVAVTATGGVAVAAATGSLPHPLTGANATASSHAPAKSSEAADRGKTPGDAKSAPSPSLVGLCHAFTAGAGDNPGKALENPAFRALITTAGGREKVAAYCDTLLAAEKAGPSRAARPTATPSHPAGRPDARPTSDGGTGTHAAEPDHKPTGRPAS